MAYKHDAIVRAWLDGKAIQRKRGDKWHDLTPSFAADKATVTPVFSIEDEFRIKPETFKYKVALLKNKQGYFTLSYSMEDTARVIESSSLFVRWLGDWQEVQELFPYEYMDQS